MVNFTKKTNKISFKTITKFHQNKVGKFHKKNKGDMTIFSHPSDHIYDSDVLKVDENNRLKKVFFKPHIEKITSNNLTMAGLFILKKKLLKQNMDQHKCKIYQSKIYRIHH